ncbi:hypothetical protein TTHERM_00170180 (macronuclear) [Tetrahymena thermophila SB210]|uniref:Uncharacterized protein n=1 Tax=Tetrahymena thermophila (strain SB210) TaxID=312017 RepID=Q22TK5_TETTS|nr:hypothetical protein TTHERM_00170180 [Tetrahymena thermophila SB210]EAR88433.1 hypothetical protein TTHERM_00170180 [Tetrahymena thermophila SB210]|eukprot:XP_001008678.1 hypothetical protein TTHERM_00170180 [Tetrahymena thermophila SB210]
MFLQRQSKSEINTFNIGSYEDLDYRSPVLNSQRFSQNSDSDKFNRQESYNSPFKMMANQNILQQQSSKDIRSSFVRNQSDNIFSSPSQTLSNGYQKNIKQSYADVRELNEYKSQQNIPKNNMNKINDINLAFNFVRNNSNNNAYENLGQLSSERSLSQKETSLQQSIQEYQKFFPHLNYNPNQKDQNASLLKYLVNQESDLLQQISKMNNNNSQQKQLKLNHLKIVSTLIQNLREQESQQIKSQIQIMQDQNIESVVYNQSDGFSVRFHLLEKIPNDVDSIQIDYGIFRKGDLLKTYRSTEQLATVSYNWKFNKCNINFEETFRNIYPTIFTFIYFDVKVYSKNVKEPKQWSWTLHTLFTEDKKLLQGCFKLPLYSKNHIPHAIFQTGFPFLSDCFLFAEVYLKQDYQLGKNITYENFVIPKLHLKEKQLDQIEEDVVVNQFVDEHIKQKGMIKSTLREDEIQMREYNARQKLRVIKKEETNYIPWASIQTLNNIVDENQQKSYIKPQSDINQNSGDIFDQISQIQDRKKQPQVKLNPPQPIQEVPQIQEPKEPIDIQEDKDNQSKLQQDSQTSIRLNSTEKISHSRQQLSQTYQKLINKRQEKSKDKQQDASNNSNAKNSKSTISVTMQRILEKRSQQNIKINQPEPEEQPKQ